MPTTDPDTLAALSAALRPGPHDGPELALDLPASTPPIPVQVEIPFRPLSLTASEQITQFERAAAGQTLTEYLRRNRTILRLQAEGDDLDKIGRILDCPLPTVRWVVSLARQGKFGRLIHKHPPGRRGQRAAIIAALRQGQDPREVARNFGSHRTTVLRALHQLHKHAA